MARFTVMVAAVMVAGALAGCAGGTPEATPEATPPAGAGGGAAGIEEAGSTVSADLLEQKCTMCHTLERVESADYDAAGWNEVIERMKRNGLVITNEEQASIAGYLSGAQ